MGRTTSWLAEQRPAMIEILTEIERNSSYTGGRASQGDMGLLLACLSHVAAGTVGSPRSVPAMRQAWWRWTTDAAQGATPPVQELALIVRHAKNQGWLRQLKSPDCLSLVSRLMRELDKSLAPEQHVLETAWAPTVLMGVEGFFDFLEARIAKHADKDFEYFLMPSEMAIQQEVRTMLTKVVERVLDTLEKPRDLFQIQHETDSYIQPFEGWPDVFRGLASEMYEILTKAAEKHEAVEASLTSSPTESGRSLRRINLFGAPPRKSDEQ